MQPVVWRSSGKRFEEFKEFNEFERVGRWEEQVLHVHHCGRESSPCAQGKEYCGRQEAAQGPLQGGLAGRGAVNFLNFRGTRKRGKFTGDDACSLMSLVMSWRVLTSAA